eukprot:12141359-Ditylum_brightwellii.AAC.1
MNLATVALPEVLDLCNRTLKLFKSLARIRKVTRFPPSFHRWPQRLSSMLNKVQDFTGSSDFKPATFVEEQ